MNLVELHPGLDCENVAAALRNIAADIEKGVYDFDPTMAVVVLGRESQTRAKDGLIDHFQWQSHGLGKSSFFSTKGLLACALNETEGTN